MSEILISKQPQHKDTLTVDQNNADNYPDNVTLERTWNDASSTKVKGQRALNNLRDENNLFLNKKTPLEAARDQIKYNDNSDAFTYKTGKNLKDFFSEGPGAFGQTFRTPGEAAFGGAALGAVALGTLGYLGKSFGLASHNDLRLAIAGGGGLGALLGLISSGYANKYYRGNQNQLQSAGNTSMLKTSSTFHDPRNVILQSLTKATDISQSQKAMLAGKVRGLSQSQAEQLAALVRNALGFGVGAIIARFVGLGPVTTLASSIMGMMGANLIANRFGQSRIAEFYTN